MLEKMLVPVMPSAIANPLKEHIKNAHGTASADEEAAPAEAEAGEAEAADAEEVSLPGSSNTEQLGLRHRGASNSGGL